MRANNVIKDCREIAVHAVSFPNQGGTVLYACSPYDTETIAGHRASRTADKIHLAAVLLEHLVGMKGSPRTDCRFSDRTDLQIQVVHDPLGRPQLLMGGREGPAISFSKGGGKLWAAVSRDMSDIGIDAAGTDEFPKEYPFHRVFHQQELQHALRLTGEDLEKAAALLWSIKEAVVKALGCGFHLVDPREITVYQSAEADGGYAFQVSLSGKALVRFPIAAARALGIHSLPQEKIWLSIALLNRRPTDHE